MLWLAPKITKFLMSARAVYIFIGGKNEEKFTKMEEEEPDEMEVAEKENKEREA
jgi:hypothetical protein